MLDLSKLLSHYNTIRHPPDTLFNPPSFCKKNPALPQSGFFFFIPKQICIDGLKRMWLAVFVGGNDPAANFR
jgi:hypothetical protein